MDKSPTHSNEPIVFHRVRRHSTKQTTTTTVPIKVSRGIHPTDGIGSPTDQAYAPPGVVTKFDSIQNRKISTINPKKMICTNCHNKTNCFCKKCTMEKLKLYSRKENVKLKYDEKNRLLNKIIEYQELPTNLKTDIAKTSERVIKLKRKFDDVEMRIAIKRDELKLEKEKRKTILTMADFKESFASQKRGIEDLEDTKNYWTTVLSKVEHVLQDARKAYCVKACRLFPVQEFDVNVEGRDVATKTTNTKHTWTVVTENWLAGRRVSIRSSFINEKLRACLSDYLTKGTVCLPFDVHPPFAAITNTVQLVHLFNLIFNFRPPVQISHHEMCIRDRWSKEIMAQDWLTLCDSIIYLCSYVGIDTKKLTHSMPHANLIEFTSYIIDRGDISKLGAKPLHNLAAVNTMLTSQRPDISARREEEDESWIIVEDFN